MANPDERVERRGRDRPPDSPCPACHAPAEKVTVTIRTSYLLFFKCTVCGRVWQVEKPAKGDRW